MRRLVILGAVLTLVGLPINVRAMHPLITDDTGTQGKGKFQIEASGTWLSDQTTSNGEGVRGFDSFATVVLAAGVAETLDVMAALPYVWTETKEAGTVSRESGYSDTVLEAKWRFFEKERLGLALKPGILLPTGDDEKGLGTGHVGYTAFLISTYETEPWAFDVNVGYLYLENRTDERVSRWFASLATRFEVAERWKIAGEVGAARNADPVCSSHPAFAQAGLVYSPKDNLDLSAGYVHGLSDSESDNSLRAGVTVRF